MSIDRSRLKNYLDEMRGLQGRVSDSNFIKRFEAKLLDLLARDQLDTDDLEFIRRQLSDLFKPEFARFDTQIKQTYNDVLEVVNQLYDDIGPDLSRQFERVRAIEQVNQLQLGHYEDKTVEAIARKVREGTLNDWNYREISAAIGKLGGQALDYADTLAQTQVKRFARVSKYNKSLIAGVEYYEYAGLLRDVIRPFCYACLNNIYHINQLEGMKNGNLEPVIINCGGWNCVHDLEPDPTATSADAVSGKFYPLPGGARIYGDEGVAKTFSYSFGLDSLVNREGIKSYIKKTRNVGITDKRLEHIRLGHDDLYGDLSDASLRAKIGYIRNNADRIYYQHNNRSGPGIVFEKNGEFLSISSRKIKTLFAPGAGYDKYIENQVQYFRRLRNYE